MADAPEITLEELRAAIERGGVRYFVEPHNRGRQLSDYQAEAVAELLIAHRARQQGGGSE